MAILRVIFNCIFLVFAITSIISVIKLNYIDNTLLGIVTSCLMLVITAFTFPLILLFAIALSISNIFLIRHEGKRFSNMLGIITGIGLLGTVAVVLVLFVLFVISGDDNIAVAVLYSIANTFYVVFISVLGGSIISGLLAGHHTPSMDKDYIIILGCAIRKDETLPFETGN